MKVLDSMIEAVKVCGPETNLAAAAALMWENDCGVLPVVDPDNTLVGIITDRDLAIAAGTRIAAARDIPVKEVMSTSIHVCAVEDDVNAALEMMRLNRVRRLPVVDQQRKLAGIICLNDIVFLAQPADGKSAVSYEEIVNTLQAICGHHVEKAPEEARYMVAGAQPA
jgi:CBS domain-containing protein